MRTLQEKYNAIQEGKFSKDNFLRDARLQLPNLITQYNGYSDAVQILKNRGMIAENTNFADYSNDALTDMVINLSRFEGNEDIIAMVKAELARRKETVKESNLGHNEISSIHQEGGSWIVTYKKDGTKEKVFKTEKEARAFEKTLNEARLTKNNLTDYRYKPTNDLDKYPYEQILRGLRVELEGLGVQGTPTAEEYKKALAKVLKNLEKDEIFYTNQLAGNNKKVDLHDKMVDATAKNTVDTFNGMKKATLKEGIKNLIKKALLESEEDIYEIQGPKEDTEYKSELADYLEGHQIYGYTNKIHDIMTGPDEDEASRELDKYLDDNQIYGYNRAIESIYADYPYEQHWMNQPDEDEADDISHPRGYEEASDEETFEDLFEEIGAGKRVTFTNKNDGEKYTGTVVRDLGNGKFTFRADQDGKVYSNDGMGSNWVIKIDEADRGGIRESAQESGLMVIGRTQIDNNAIGDVLDELELHGEWNTREGYWILPEDEENYDSLEEMLEQEFATRGINARFEGIFSENIFESVSLKDLL